MIIDTHELAWVAGFFDGEGSVGANKNGTDECPRVVLKIGQTERTTMERALRAFGFGKIYGPYPRPGNRKSVYNFYTTSFENTQAAVALMWRWLSGPKRRQAIVALTKMKDYSARRYATQELRLLICPYGHRKTPSAPMQTRSDVTRYGNYRRCYECDRMRRLSRKNAETA